MAEYNKLINEFLQKTCAQIRFKSLHKSITNELYDHIEEQKLEYIKEGLGEETAVKKAIEQMGDPVLVGKQLNKAHQPKTEWSILLLTAILVAIGGTFQFFASRANILSTSAYPNFLIYMSIGIAAFSVTYFFDYAIIGKYPKTVYAILFLVTTVGFLFSGTRNGVHIHAYYSALLFIPVYAGVIYGFRNKGYGGILACGLFYIPVALICMLAPSVTSFIMVSVAFLIMLTIAITKGYFKCNKKVGLSIVYIPTAIITMLSLLLLNSRTRARLSVMFIPELDPLGAGFSHLIVKKLIAASQSFGEAVLDSKLANTPIERLLPSCYTDFSLTFIIAKFGYIPGIAITLIFIILITQMFRAVIKQQNRLGLLLSCAACISITSQFILLFLSNTGVITGFSTTLPFISFGGMGFVTNMILVGIVLSVYRRTNIAIENKQDDYQAKKLLTFEDGKLIIDFGSLSSKDTE